MELGTLFNFAILLFCGLIFAKIIRYFKLPDVTGYLIGGLIIGPSVLGLLSADAVAGFRSYRTWRWALSHFPSAVSSSSAISSVWA